MSNLDKTTPKYGFGIRMALTRSTTWIYIVIPNSWLVLQLWYRSVRFLDALIIFCFNTMPSPVYRSNIRLKLLASFMNWCFDLQVTVECDGPNLTQHVNRRAPWLIQKHLHTRPSPLQRPWVLGGPLLAAELSKKQKKQRKDIRYPQNHDLIDCVHNILYRFLM